VVTFADDTTSIAVGDTVEKATEKLQITVEELIKWISKWLVNLNEAKSIYVDLTNKRCQHIPSTINDKVISHSNNAKYPGMMQEAKQRWKAHVKKKREELGLKYKKMYWLM